MPGDQILTIDVSFSERPHLDSIISFSPRDILAQLGNIKVNKRKWGGQGDSCSDRTLMAEAKVASKKAHNIRFYPASGCSTDEDLQFSLFAGKILTDDFADKEGLEMGDEYFANLDHIESVENFKEGYESDVPSSSDSSGVDMKDQEDGNSGSEDPEESNDDSSDDNFCKDEDFSTSSVWRSYATRRQTRGQKESELSEVTSKDSRAPDRGPPHVPITPSGSVGGCNPPSSEETPKNKVASWLSCNSVSEGGFADSDSRSSFKTSEGGDGRAGGGRGEAERASTSGLSFKDEGDSKQSKKEVRNLRAVLLPCRSNLL